MSDVKAVYTFTAEQMTRMQKLMDNTSREITPNEKMKQIVDRGLSALELQTKARERQKELLDLGRQKEKELVTTKDPQAVRFNQVGRR